MRHAADDRVWFSLFGVPAEGGAGARRADRYRARHVVAALSHGGQSGRRRGGNVARAVAAPRSEGRRQMAAAYRQQCFRMVEDARGPRHGGGGSGQSAARHLGVVATPARGRDRHERFRVMRELVCARSENAPRHDGFAVRRPGVDGRSGPLRDRRQIRPSRSAGHRVGRRRRHADEQHG